MGALVHNKDLENDADVEEIRNSLNQNGVVVLRSNPPYKLTREDQLRFTGKLGRTIRLPEVFGGQVGVFFCI